MRCTTCTRGHAPLFGINHPVPARRTGRKLYPRCCSGTGVVCICVRRRRRSVRVQRHIFPRRKNVSVREEFIKRAGTIYRARRPQMHRAVASITRVRRILAVSARRRGLHPPRVIYDLYDLFARNIITHAGLRIRIYIYTRR